MRGQALVEFALVGPLLLLLLLLVLDFGRGIFYYVEMSEGAREGARQAVLQYNQDSNQNPGACSTCQVPGVMPQVRTMASFGYPVVYLNSSNTSTVPSYASSYAPDCGAPPCDQPGTIALASSASVNTVYVFIYELDPSTGNAIWAPPPSVRTTPVRNGSHRKVVIDLKLKFQPMFLRYIGFGQPSILLDAQTVEREEYS
jgi:TadE-like protein